MNPFAKDPANAISSLGESALIEKLRAWLGDASPREPYGIGDDCAVLPASTPGCQQLVTADPIIYRSHFDDSLSPEQSAAKLLRRNLSDIASMGGRPTHAVISLALDPSVSISWIEAFYQALAREAKAHQTHIVGGDVSSADHFIGAFLTQYGETLPNTKPLLRHSAKAGSPIYVTGSLGGTRIQKHHDFTPRLSEGQWLSKRGDCLSCSDLSDGLGKDFANIIPPSLACEINCQQVPISQDAQSTASHSGQSELYHAFNDGEDFELIFALDPKTAPAQFQADWEKEFKTPLHRIGTVVENPTRKPATLNLLNAPDAFKATGYEHLR